MLSDEEFENYFSNWATQEGENYKTINHKSGTQEKKYLKKNYDHFDNRFWFPERKNELREILKNNLRFFSKKNKRWENWAFSPFLKVLIKTPRYKEQSDASFDLETKTRPICYASHIDSLIFSFHSFVLTRKYEDYILKNGFSQCPIAYRSNLNGNSNIQFSKEVFEYIRNKGLCAAIALDITGYFDHIDHITLKEKWIKILGKKIPDDQFRIFKAMTKYSYVKKDNILKKYNINLKELNKKPQTLLELVPGDQDYQKYDQLRADRLIVTNKKPNQKSKRLCGIPQGSPMSSVLSNIYLIDFDKDINEKAISENFFYRRYCDDLLIVCEIDNVHEIRNYLINKIQTEYFLEIQNKKVETIVFRPNSKGVLRAFNYTKFKKCGISQLNSKNERQFYKSLQYLGFEFNGQDILVRSSSLSRYFRKMTGRIVKTVMMAYGKKSKENIIKKRQILERYSHLGERNFLTYAYKASREKYTNSKGEEKTGMNSLAIRKQLSRHITILAKKLELKNNQRFESKKKKNKLTQKKWTKSLEISDFPIELINFLKMFGKKT
jgi:RNA-directed DNA polymerase